VIVISRVAGCTLVFRLVMSKSTRIPTLWGVAGIAIFAKLSLMFICLCVAGIAFCWCIFCETGNMAFLAAQFLVLAFQRKGCPAVTKAGRYPRFRGMANTTFCAEFFLMNVVFQMASYTLDLLHKYAIIGG